MHEPAGYEADIIVTTLGTIREDAIHPNKPYIPAIPRSEHSLVYIVSGGLDYILGSERVHAAEGSILLIKKGHIDRSEAANSQPCRYIFINFDTPQEMADITIPLDCLNSAKDVSFYPSAFAEALHAWNSKGPGFLLKCREILYGILHRLLVDNKYGEDGGLYHKFRKIGGAISYLNFNYSNPAITVGLLACLCGMSPSNLNKLFRDLLHTSPMEYLVQIRMNNAKELLLNSTNSVGEISARVGYANIFGFSRAFKRHTGVAPSLWIFRQDCGK